MGVALAIVVGVIGGLAIGLQGPSASLMSQRIGSLESAFIVHLGGALMLAVPLLILGGGGLGGWRSVPWYALLSGGLGIILIVSISYTIPRLGIASTVALLIFGQLGVGALLDHFGALGVEARSFGMTRALGFGVLLAGTWLISR